jgi:hypothetical protein
MIKTNKAMEEVINKNHDKYLFSELTHILWPDFIEVNGCILINDEKPGEGEKLLNMDHILKNFGDRTGFEAFESHVHMMDVSKEFEDNPLMGLMFALKLVEVWSAKLKSDFPGYSFYLILSFDGQDSILRFHKIRENENWVDIDNLNSYDNTAILIKKVN